MTLDTIEAERHTNLYVRIAYDGGMTAGGYLYLDDHQAKQLAEDLRSALEDTSEDA